MSEEELAAIELLLEKAEEVTCSLYFSTGTWQLREADVSDHLQNIYMNDILCRWLKLQKDLNLLM